MSRFSSMAAAAACALACTLAQAGVVLYTTTLSGAAEAPPNASLGTGFANVYYNDLAHTLAIHAEFSGLTGITTVAHIHCCTAVAGAGLANVAVTPSTLPGFPAGVTSGTYDVVLDLTLASTFTTGFVNSFAGGVLADAEEALIAGFDAGKAYFNIHSTQFPAGEIRGFLQVPEPTSLALMALCLAALGATSRRKSA